MWTIGERLRERRERSGMEAKDAAKAIGISKSYLSMLETGGSTPNWELLGALAKLYATTSDYIIGLSEDPRSEKTALPHYGEELLKVFAVLSDERRLELLGHAQVLLEAERRVPNTTKLEIMLDMVHAIGGEEAVDAAVEIMELAATDQAAATAKMDEYFDSKPRGPRKLELNEDDAGGDFKPRSARPDMFNPPDHDDSPPIARRSPRSI